MPKYYEAYEKRYRQVHEQSLSWSSDKNSPIVADTLKKYVKADKPRILDVGCGEGRDCLYLMKQGYDVQAIDISEEAIRYCRQRAGAEYENRFRVLDVCRSELEGRFDFIYSVATLHMLVLQQDRERYLSFIKNHLSEGGYALILSMGDGVMESESNINEAFEDKTRVHQETGKELSIASTSCKMVSFDTLRKELHGAGFSAEEDGLTEAPPDFPVIMYAVVR
ncbi:MAG: class I SAM-dependent methyltransferase [Oscillospiraceae bacterium]|nr:class I SAM-dependent methyltransferase [Oscillospiraceae bacterium]